MIDLKNKNVLVTGGTGMIGSQLIPLLHQEGCNITCVSIDSPVEVNFDVNFKEVDLCFFQNCLDVTEDIDIVFHLAGIKGSPQRCRKHPASMLVPMLQFNTNILEASRINNVEWIMYTSSYGVYKPDSLYKEDDLWVKHIPFTSHDFYGGWSKRIGELQLLAYSKEYNFNNFSIIRPANVYGPYDFSKEKSMVVSSFITKCLENPVLEVMGDGSQIRDFIFSRDVARGMLYAVKHEINEPLNMGCGEGVVIKDLAKIISNYFGKDIVYDTSITETGEPVRIMDMTRAYSYGYKPEVSFEQGLNETIKWFEGEYCGRDI